MYWRECKKQISKSHALILHEHWLLNPRHGACSANASPGPFPPVPYGQGSSNPGYPEESLQLELS